MKLIKNALVYRISLPGAELLRGHLAEIKHRDIQPQEAVNYGFVPVIEDDLVFSSGDVVAFSIKIDRKILPMAAVHAAVFMRALKIEETEGRKVGRKELSELHDHVAADMLTTALTVSKVITSFYHTPSKLLIVPVSSQGDADIVTSLLIRAVGSAKTETIHISNLKGGLTARLRKEMVESGDGFGDFVLEPQVWLKREKEKVTYQLEEIGDKKKGVLDVLDEGFEVDAVRLNFEPVSFKLTNEFAFKSIKYGDQEDAPEAADAVDQFGIDAAYQVFSLVSAIEALCVLLDYKAPETETETESAE